MRVPCPQCAAEVQVQDTTGCLTCPFCGSSLVLDLTGVRLHRVYRPRHDAAAVLPHLRRFCDAHGLPAPSQLSAPSLSYYPFWRYMPRGGPRLVPAWSTLEARWREVATPEAEQALYDAAALKGARVVEATEAEEAARRRAFGEEAVAPGELAHIPFYEQRALLGGKRMAFAVEACSGRVYADHLPPGARIGEGREGFKIGLALLLFAVMFAGAAVVPPGWLALLVVGFIGWVAYWMMPEGWRT